MKRILALVLSLVLVFSFASCAKPATNTTDDTTAPVSAEQSTGKFVFVAVDLDGKETTFDVPYTSGQKVGDALIAEGLIAGEEGDYGLYVKTVNGITLDYDKDGAYWAFYEGDEYGSTGVDQTDITDGATYKMVATKG